MNALPFGFRAAAAATAAALLVGCASPVPQRSSEWVEPALGAQSRILRSDKVLVACEAWDLAMRQNCQASLYRELQARGAQPVMPRDPTLTSGRDMDNQLAAEAANVGARSILVLALTPVAMGGGGLSGASIGVGGFSWGRSSGAGVGIGVPIGGAGGGWGSTGFAAQSRVMDAQQNRLLWSASFSPGSGDPNSQVQGLANAVVTAAQGAGLL